MNRMGLAPRVLFLGVLAAATALFWLQLCDLVYDCGCLGLWAGAAEHCNVHQAPAGSPHRCPWCASPLAGGVSFVGTMTWFSLALLRRWPARLGTWSWSGELLARLTTAGLAIPVFAFAVGWISGQLMGYWG